MRVRRPPSILNWAGSKARIARILCDQRLIKVERYHEPFLGSGAAYLAFASAGLISTGVLSDLNPHIVNVFQAIQSQSNEVMSYLRMHALLDSDVHFSSVLGRLNTQRLASIPNSQCASDTIYLLSRSFHSGWYETLDGQIYMSHRQKGKPFKPNYQDFVRAATLLESASIKYRDFRLALQDVGSGDLVFLDPPYLYGGKQRDQQAYNSKRFNADDFSDLTGIMRELVDRGAQVVFCWGEHAEEAVPKNGRWFECGQDFCWTSNHNHN
jgi:DNA adenine methylase